MDTRCNIVQAVYWRNHLYQNTDNNFTNCILYNTDFSSYVNNVREYFYRRNIPSTNFNFH